MPIFKRNKEAPISDHGTFLVAFFGRDHICGGEEIDLYFKLDVRLDGTTLSLFF